MARVDAHLADRLATVPGVARSVVDRSFDVQVELAHAPTAGHGWSSAALTPYRLVDGRAPEVASEVVLGRTEASGAAIAVGDTITVTVGQARRAITVVGVATTTASVDAEALFFTDHVATELSGTGGRADLIGIITEDGVSPSAVADRVAAALPEGLAGPDR